ncbi:MAG: hypothetical protein AB8E15_12660 [Bdellovibrionales bacterium]
MNFFGTLVLSLFFVLSASSNPGPSEFELSEAYEQLSLNSGDSTAEDIILSLNIVKRLSEESGSSIADSVNSFIRILASTKNTSSTRTIFDAIFITDLDRHELDLADLILGVSKFLETRSTFHSSILEDTVGLILLAAQSSDLETAIQVYKKLVVLEIYNYENHYSYYEVVQGESRTNRLLPPSTFDDTLELKAAFVAIFGIDAPESIK